MKKDTCQHLIALAVKNARQAIEAVRSQSELIANLSYELRTSLTGIFGMVQLLAIDCYLPTQQRYINDILEASDSILHSIDRLSKLSEFLNIQHAEPLASVRVFNLRALLERVGKQLLFQTRLQCPQFLLNYPDRVTDVWVGEPDLIYQLALHLSKYVFVRVEFNTIMVHVDCMFEDSDRTQTGVLLNIECHGRELEETELSQLKAYFEKENAGKILPYRYRPVSFYLVIVASYLKLLNATLEIENIVGKGGRFICRIPLKRFNGTSEVDMLQQYKDSLAHLDLSRLRVLLVEDNALIQRVYSLIFEKIKVGLVDTASNAERALECYMRCPYDLILMDINLPDSDGVAITKIIRQQEIKGEHIPIIALTAHSQQINKEVFMANGFDEILVKPVKLKEMIGLLERWARETDKLFQAS